MKTSLHKYKLLSIVERAKIELLYVQGHKQEYIANIIGVHKSTVSRELKLGWYYREPEEDIAAVFAEGHKL